MDTRHDEDLDVRLMLRVRAGDDEAFSELVERHGSALIGFFMRAASPAAAEDLAQDCLLRVFRAAHRYEPRARFQTWLYAIATNLALNHRRGGRFRNHHGLSHDDDWAGESEAEAPEYRVQKEELRRRVRKAIADLPDQQRIAIVLTRYEELSLVETAEVMGNTVSAVKSLLNRAREHLRESLARDLSSYSHLAEGPDGG